MKPISEVTNEDCMIMMSRYPDKFFDLAIVDPLYSDPNKEIVWGYRFGGRFDIYKKDDTAKKNS